MKITTNLIMICGIITGHLTAVLGAEPLKLPSPALKGSVSVEEALQGRRAVRRFSSRSLDLPQVGQLLWAADGINHPEGKRTAPSGRAAYPMELYLVVGERGVPNLAPGLYRYLVKEHALEPTIQGELRAAVARACNSQAWMTEAPVMAVITGDYRRSAVKNGDQATVFTHMEAGFLGQNLFLQAGALGLGAGVVGGFDAQALSQVLKLPAELTPFLVVPLGYKH